MDFSVKEQNLDQFYHIYASWCETRGWPVQNREELDRVFVCYRGSVPIYSCFFWSTPSQFAVIGFPFANPHINYEVRRGGMAFLFERMCELIKKEGYRVLWTTSNTDRVIEAMKEVGFQVADKNVDQYYKRLF